MRIQLRGPEKFIGAEDPRHTLHEKGGLAGTLIGDGDILWHPILWLS